jgi:FMN phosphatase YigB (HAD superfamily)
MSKPILATTLAGLFVKSDPWKYAHKQWFTKAATTLRDPAVAAWASKENYFPGVEIVMKRLHPQFTDAERSALARQLFFDGVCEHIQTHDVRRHDVIEYFRSLKSKYTIALVTTNTAAAASRILELADIDHLFDITIASDSYEKDDKALVFDRFVAEYGKPVLYIGGERRDSYEYCLKHKISCVYANFDNQSDIASIDSVHSIHELKEIIDAL